MGDGRPGEAELFDLLRRATQLTADVNALALDHLQGRTTDGFRLLGAGLEQTDAGFIALEASCTRQLASVMPVLPFDPWGPGPTLDERSRRRGIEILSVYSRRSLTVNPLLSSMDPSVRIGHAVITMWVVDRARVVLPGPLTADGAPTLFTAVNPSVLEPSLELWDLIFASSAPVLAEDEQAPFTPRQVRVAILMARGAKDASMARELGVSVRTVVSDVAQLVSKLGATSRVDAVLALRRGHGRV